MSFKQFLKDKFNEFDMDETFTRPVKKELTNNVGRDQINLHENFNYMADILFLPTSKFGYKYLFVILDRATNKFDIEPLKNKETTNALSAMKKCFNRKPNILTEPKYSITTDSGSEFRGVFHKYLYDESIFQKVIAAGNHNGMRQIDLLCKQLGRIIMTYLVNKEMKRNKTQKDWLVLIPVIRKELNEYRKIDTPKDINSYVYPSPMTTVDVKKGKKTFLKRIKPKFDVGEMVHHYLLTPVDYKGKKFTDGKRRQGDISWSREPREITNIVIMNGKGPVYRYLLKGFDGKSFTENELFLA